MLTPAKLGRYHATSIIRQAGKFITYSCTNFDGTDHFIIKTVSSDDFSSDQVSYLRREFEVAKKSQGPNIVEVLDLEITDAEIPLLVFKKPSGVPFEFNSPHLSPTSYIPIFIEIIKTISRLHEKKIIHRDLNPNSIYWDETNGSISIVDFQHATDIFTLNAKDNDLDHLNESLKYISPEQTGRMNRRVDYRSDFYSLGLVFYHFLTDSMPFQAIDAIGWIYCHIAEKPMTAHAKNSNVPFAISQIIDKLISKNAEDRYQSSYGIITDLQTVNDNLCLKHATLFTPGQNDTNQWLSIPEKLYGREEELDEFFEIFKQSLDGKKLICTILGSSGMGKSVLVNEINKPIAKARGHFIVGKCDQYKRNVPYAAIREAFSDLIRQHFTKQVSEVEIIKSEILNEIGNNAKAITEIIPEFELLTGPQKQLIRLGVSESRARFHEAFEKLINIITGNGHPLAVFLDDLQWSDLPSLNLIEYLMTKAELKYVMFVAVYRDNEVSPGHPLLNSLANIREVITINDIMIRPLSIDSTTRLLSDTLHEDVQNVHDLAHIIYLKTAGNPFHIKEIIKTLYEADAIYFQSDIGKWRWSVEKVLNANINENVVELMISTLQRCSNEAQRILKMAACLGAQFELNSLSIICDINIIDLLEIVWPTIEKGLLIPIGESYKLIQTGLQSEGKSFYCKFQHDRVHEAAYLLISDSERPIVHLNIGRQLYENTDKNSLENHVIDIVRHYNLGHDLIKDPSEKVLAINLNYLAGIKSRNAVAYDAFLHYLLQSRMYLSHNSWTENYDLSFKTYMALSEAAFFMANYGLVEDINKTLLEHARDTFDATEVKSMVVQQKFRQGLLEDALKVGRSILQTLGVNIPSYPSDLTLLFHMIRIKYLISRSNLDSILNNKELSDRRILIIHRQLFALGPILYSTGDLNACLLCGFEGTRYSLKYGNCPESAYAFMVTASIIGNVMRDYSTSYKVAQFALGVEEKYPKIKLRPNVYYIYGTFISQYHTNLDEDQKHGSQIIEAGLAVGDQFVMPATAATFTRNCPHLNLEESILKTENYYLHLVEKSNNPHCLQLALLLQRTKIALVYGLDEEQQKDKERLDQFSEQVFIETKFTPGIFFLSVEKALLNFIFGKIQLAYIDINLAQKNFNTGIGLLHEIDFHFIQVLILTRVYLNESRKNKRSILKRIAFSFKRMAPLSRHHPYNYQHIMLAMKAELQRMKRNWQNAEQLYRQSIESAPPVFLRNVAIIHELAANFYLELGNKKIANFFIKDAFLHYKKWKAFGKLDLLTAEWPVLTSDINYTKSTMSAHKDSDISSAIDENPNSSSIDIEAITRAAQTISGQVEMKSLIRHLMHIIIENTGAQYAALMLNEDESSRIFVMATATGSSTDIVPKVNISEFSDISISVMLYSSRTGETIIIDELEKDAKFRSDPYLLRTKPKSVMAMPIKISGRVIGYFYLENRITSGSFTRERVEVLNILGAQAAISLENAQLYESLEHKVEERTNQLVEKNRDIKSMMSNIKQGILTVSADLTINHEYSKHLESILERSNLGSKSFITTLFESAEISRDALNQIESALYLSINENSIGYLSNSALLVSEVTRTTSNGETQYLEIDWEPILSDFDIVEKIMVTIRDVTELRRLRQKTASVQHDLLMLSQLLKSGAEKFKQFIAESTLFIHQIEALIETSKHDVRKPIDSALRILHTLKGNARILGYTDIAEAVHDCESKLDEISSGGYLFSLAHFSEITGLIGTIKEQLSAYSALFHDKLVAFSNQEIIDQYDKAISIFKQHLSTIKKESPANAAMLDQILRNLSNISLQEILAPIISNTNKIASDLGKETPIILVNKGGILFAKDETSLIRGIFIHLFSNSMTHGIETPSERIFAKKELQGTITLNIDERVDGFYFEFFDDGAGLDLHKIREKGITKGLIDESQSMSDFDIANLIFESGLSTKDGVTHIAGRGVGMDAVKEMVETNGGQMILKITEKHGAKCQFKLHFVLPLSKYSVTLYSEA